MCDLDTPTLAACRQHCELPVKRLRLVAADLRAQMCAGLASDGCMLRMLPTFVTQLPSGYAPQRRCFHASRWPQRVSRGY